MLRLMVLMLVSTAATAQMPRVAQLEWMAGTWVSEARGTVTETWLGPGHGVMVAANLSNLPEGRSTYEFLRIAQTPEGFSYFASPGGREPVEFKLKALGERMVAFENPARDFPRRILYRREGDTLIARIEGTLKGQPAHEEWRFTKR